MNKINVFLINTNRYLFLLIIICFGVVLNIGMSLFVYHFFEVNLGGENETSFFSSLTSEYIMVVFLAPLIETAIFQYLFIVMLLKRFIKKVTLNYMLLLIMISSLLFAMIHIYSFFYFLIAFIMGLYLGYITLLSEFFREKKINVFISVFLTHSMINLVAMLLD
jgi:hypothetical protein